jgi:hypothetical protein
LHRITDIETPAVAAQIPLIMPSTVTIHLVFGVESTLFNHGQTKRHRSVVGPFTWLKTEWAAANPD